MNRKICNGYDISRRHRLQAVSIGREGIADCIVMNTLDVLLLGGDLAKSSSIRVATNSAELGNVDTINPLVHDACGPFFAFCRHDLRRVSERLIDMIVRPLIPSFKPEMHFSFESRNPIL